MFDVFFADLSFLFTAFSLDEFGIMIEAFLAFCVICSCFILLLRSVK